VNLSHQEALKYCIDVLGWKDASIPSNAVREKLGLYNENVVYEHEPQDFFDTPRTFQFAVVEP